MLLKILTVLLRFNLVELITVDRTVTKMVARRRRFESKETSFRVA